MERFGLPPLLVMAMCVSIAVVWTIFCNQYSSPTLPLHHVPHFHVICSASQSSCAQPLKLLRASFISIVLVSSCRLRSGAGPTSDERRGGAAAAVGFGHEQGGESEGRSQRANTPHVSLAVLVMKKKNPNKPKHLHAARSFSCYHSNGCGQTTPA